MPSVQDIPGYPYKHQGRAKHNGLGEKDRPNDRNGDERRRIETRQHRNCCLSRICTQDRTIEVAAQAEHHQIVGDSHNDLIRLHRHIHPGKTKVRYQPGRQGRGQPHPGVAGHVGAQKTRQRADQNRPLDADIHYARTLGINLAGGRQ